jgi:hypothetical protein
VEGILLSDIEPSEMAILDWYEEVGYYYSRMSIPVAHFNPIANDNHKKGELDIVNANVYVWCAEHKLLNLESSWSFGKFCDNYLDIYMNETVIPCRDKIERKLCLSCIKI